MQGDNGRTQRGEAYSVLESQDLRRDVYLAEISRIRAQDGRGESVNCPVCGKELSESTNDEDCPNSPYWHGKHAIAIVDDRVYAQPARPKTLDSSCKLLR